MTFVLLFAALMIHHESVFQVGMGTCYWPNDGYSGPIRADGKPFKEFDDHIAHRELPLGSWVVVCNLRNFHCTSTTVRDRGSYGYCKYQRDSLQYCPHKPLWANWRNTNTCLSGYKYTVKTKRSRRDCGYYLGIADLTRPVARRVKFSGLDPVLLIRLPKSIKPWMRTRIFKEVTS